MRTLWGLGLLALALLAGCHTMVGHEPAAPDGGAARDLRGEAVTRDAPAPPDRPLLAEQGGLDRGVDRSALDRGAPDRAPDLAPPPDLPPKPDTYPVFATSSCASLWLGGPVLQLSASSSDAAGRPAIINVGTSLYVVYGEGGVVYLHSVSPTGDLGRTAIGDALPSQTPTLAVAAGAANELGVVWERAANASGCPAALRFAKFDAPYTSAVLPPSNAITSTNCQQRYSNPSLVHTGTQYALQAPAQYACTNGTHYKPLAHFFTIANGGASCYTGNPETYATVLHKLSPTRYAAAHLFRSSLAAPYAITVFRNDGISATQGWGAWPTTAPLSVGSTLPGTSLTDHRPAASSLGDTSGDTLFLAWMDSSERLHTSACAWPAGSATPPACTAPLPFLPPNVDTSRTYAHPALAASAAHKNVLLLAYASSLPGLGVAKLREGSIAITAPVEQPIARPGKPRFAALAAHPEGFGLTWLEPVNGVDEVFYKFIGCMP